MKMIQEEQGIEIKPWRSTVDIFYFVYKTLLIQV